jgi:Cu/Zn superoxide dismutase
MPPQKKKAATKSSSAAETCNPGDIVVFDDGTDIECQALVAECNEKGEAGLHVFRKGKNGAIWHEAVPHYNQAKKGAHWKKAS